MKWIAANRLNLIPMPSGPGLSKRNKLILLTELAGLGYCLTNHELLDQASDEMLLDFAGLIANLERKRGGDVAYVPLFLGFPEDTPEDDAYWTKRILGFFGNIAGLFPEGTRLENGYVIPDWLFDLRAFGADPITQFQTLPQWTDARRKEDACKDDGHVHWLNLELVKNEELPQRLATWLRHCLYAKSSVKEALREDIELTLRYLGEEVIDFDQIVMKENQALVLAILWRAGKLDRISQIVQTPTDLLRLFAALTQTDVSLADGVRFPAFTRAQRRMLMACLERFSHPAEDLKRYRGLWLKLARSLHSGEYRTRFPKACAAIEALRNGKIITFGSRTEELLQQRNLPLLLAHLKQRPGVLARKIHELLRGFPKDTDLILDLFVACSSAMTLKQLLVLFSYAGSINEKPFRPVYIKRGKLVILPNNALAALDQEQIQVWKAVIHEAMSRRLRLREDWCGKKVWIDPRLNTQTVPLQQRKASDGLVMAGRGSRIPIDFDKVLRLFVYWKETGLRTDLDLSALMLDASFKYAGHVSYTRLAEDGIIHSGDIQSAPFGAAEFIDISLNRVDPKARYIAILVFRYAGSPFSRLSCHAGWMVREKVDPQYKSFDVKTVVNKFELTGDAAYCVPLVIDVQKGEALVTDLYMGRKAFRNCVEGAYHNLSAAVREINDFINTRPVMAVLAQLHTTARGATLTDREEDADITFGLENHTYNTCDIEKILTELL